MQKSSMLLAFADFQALGQHNATQTVYLLQALLLDEQACLLRIAWLREITRGVRERHPDLKCASGPSFVSHVLSLIPEPGLLASWRQGTVSFMDLEALTRSPRALYEAQCLLLEQVPEPWPEGEEDLVVSSADLLDEVDKGPASTPSPYTSQTSMSALLGREEYERFRQRLEKYPLLAELLATIELSPALNGELLQFIQDQCRHWSGKGDLIETMLAWLHDFAVAQHSRVDVRLDRQQFAWIVRRVVVRYHLERVKVEEPFEVAFRDAAFVELRRNFGSTQEAVEALWQVRIYVAPEQEPDFELQRREWIGHIRDALVSAEAVWRLAG